jgi:hypothetical protein
MDKPGERAVALSRLKWDIMEQPGLENSNRNQAARSEAESDASSLFHVTAATIIYNPNGTISGRPQYGPSGDIPTPNGGTVIYRPQNTEIGTNGQILRPGQTGAPVQPGVFAPPAAPARPGQDTWRPATDQLPGNQQPTIGAPSYGAGSYTWNQAQGLPNQQQRDRVDRSLTGDFNTDRFFGLYNFQGAPIIGQVAVPLPLGVIGGSIFGSGAVPYWMDNKFARPVTAEDFVKKTDAELRAEGSNGEELIRLRDSLKSMRDADAPYVQQREVLRQIENLNGPGGFIPGGYIGNWWRKYHSPLLAQTDHVRSEVDEVDNARTEKKKALTDLDKKEGEARTAFEKANKTLTGSLTAGAPDIADAWIARHIDLPDAAAFSEKGLLGQALVQKQRLLKMEQLQKTDPGAAAALFEKFDDRFKALLRSRTNTPATEVPVVDLQDANILQAKISLLDRVDKDLISTGTLEEWRKKIEDLKSEVNGSTVTPKKDYGLDHFLTDQEHDLLMGGGSGTKAITGVIQSRDNLYVAQTATNMVKSDIAKKDQTIFEKLRQVKTLQQPASRDISWNDKVPERVFGDATNSQHFVSTGPRYYFKIEGTPDESGRITAGSGPIGDWEKLQKRGPMQKDWLNWQGDNIGRRVAQGMGIAAIGIVGDGLIDTAINRGSFTDKSHVFQAAEGPLAGLALMSKATLPTKAAYFVGAIAGAKWLDHHYFPNGASQQFGDVFKPTTLQGFAMGLGWALPFRTEAKYARAGAMLGGWALGGPVANLAATAIERQVPFGDKLEPLFQWAGIGSSRGDQGYREKMDTTLSSFQTNRTTDGFKAVVDDGNALASRNWANLDDVKYQFLSQHKNDATNPPNLETLAALTMGRADYWLAAGTDVELKGSAARADQNQAEWPHRMLAGLNLDLGGQALGLFSGGHNVDNFGYAQAESALAQAQQGYSQAGRADDAKRVQDELQLVRTKIGEICDGQHDIQAAYNRLMQAIGPQVGNAEGSVPKFEDFVGLVRNVVRAHANDSNLQLKAKLYRDLALLDAVEAAYYSQTRLTTANGTSAAAVFNEGQQALNFARQFDPQAGDQAPLENLLNSLAPTVQNAQRTQQTSPLGNPFGAG